MNQNPISQDDPRLTLYALHEMEPAEREGFEKLLQQDPVAQATVEEIRATAAVITTALEHEPADAIRRPTGKVLRFPQVYFMISGLAAACFALFFTYWQQSRPVPRSYTEIELDKVVAAKDQKKERQEGADADAAKAKARSEMSVTMALAESPTVPMDVAEAPAPVFSLETSSRVAELAKNSEAKKTDSVDSAFALNDLAMAPSAPPPAQSKEEILALQPFEVSSEADAEYATATTIAGSRLNTELRDIGNAVPVEREKFLRDIGATDKRYFGAVTYNRGASTLKRARNPESIALLGAQRNFNTEAYDFRKDNDYIRVKDQALSTFSVDVDTASYANMRRFLTQGQRPPADAVRIEELVNYFPYRYTPPAGNAPFAAHLEVASAPWAPEHRLVRIGLKGREISDDQRPAANLVFLIDVSGSMRPANRLPLVKQSLRLLVNKLRSDDRVAIAVYAGASGLALPSTSASRKADILDAIDHLEAGGSTNGALGIQLAYDIAKANFVSGGVNRVILATDGDFNVGVTNNGELTRLIEEKAKSGVFLSVLGFGMGNLKDSTLEQLADKGNGNYAYIDTLAEARKSLVEQAGGTLVTIAKDVKIQVEFNPVQVQAYRLIGYENRLLAKEDFKNDKVDAGEIGAGHTVTALYEIVPAGAEMPTEVPAVDALKYQKTEDRKQTTENRGQKAGNSPELLTVKIRYKEPAGDVSIPLEFPLVDAGARFEQASADFKFAAAVAGFGMALRDSPHKGSLTLAEVADWGRAGLGEDAGGYRTEFLGLVRQVEALQ
jgi:Ca-activated chloride channel family protein